MQWWKWLLAAVFIWGMYNSFVTREIQHTPGILAPQIPEQTMLNQPSFRHSDFTIEPLADFSIRARVLSRKNYSLGREAILSPMDLALGWGPMSDTEVLRNLDISQSNRFYFWRYEGAPPIAPQSIIENSSNVHLIPANEKVLKQLERIRVGTIVNLQGKLIQASGDDGFTWRSSLTRSDAGAGACEIMWVESVSIYKH